MSVRLEAAPYETARWIVSDKPDVLQRFRDANRSSIAEDKARLAGVPRAQRVGAEPRDAGLAGYPVRQRERTQN